MRAVTVAGTVVLLLAVGAPLGAFPTSLLLVPTADVMEPHTARVETELDLATSPFGGDVTYGFYAQIGLTPRFELGLDVVGLGDDPEWLGNAKWQVFPEGDHTPAVAVGLLNATEDEPLQPWYVVGSRQMGQVRVHAGLLHDSQYRGALGAEYYWDDRTGVLADWTTGRWGYHSLGLWRDLGNGFAATVYWAQANTDDDESFSGLNLYHEFGW